MITGVVTDDGILLLMMEVAGRQWKTIVDTGFNGDLELPVALTESLTTTWIGPVESALAADQYIMEVLYAVDFEFDGEPRRVEATFVEGETILIGTRLLRRHKLEIDFVARQLRIERVE